MATLMRFEPFADFNSLRRTMDRLFEDSRVRPRSRLAAFSNGSAALALDVRETDEAYLVEAAVPGVKPDDIDITISDDVLVIKGKINDESETKDGTYLLRERRLSSFSRALRLPEAIVSDEAEANFENGILTLTIPKAEEAKPKVIQVKAK